MPAQTRLFLCLKDNFGALLHDPESGATAAIDAPEAAPVEAALKSTGWRLSDILVTHHHADHTGGIAELKQRHRCRVTAPHGEAACSRRRGTPRATSAMSFPPTSLPSSAIRCSRSAAAASSRARRK